MDSFLGHPVYCIHLQAFSSVKIPQLLHLNIRGNPMEENSAHELLEMLKRFSSLNSLEVMP